MAKNGNERMRSTIFTTDKEAQYDEKAKQILGQKWVLTYILIHTVEEFKGMKPEKVISYIEGEPYIGNVPVEPGLTNTLSKSNGTMISGLNTENSEINEGETYFDVLFYARTRDRASKMILDIEAQKDEPSGYDILNRAVFYVSREISSQKNREFVKSEYNNIKQVYSIWICMNQKKNTLEWYHLTKESRLEVKDWKGRTDLINIVMIGLAKRLPEQSEEYKMHRLLGALFSQELDAKEKIEILEKEYGIPMEEKFRKDVKEMCNLSQGIKESGRMEGRQEGIEIGRMKEMINTEKEKQRADELERQNARLMEVLADHGLTV